jgi:serine/threonine protein kinase
MEPIGEEFLWNSEIFKGWLSENKTHQYDETKNILDGDLGINDPKKQITFNDFDMLKRLGNGAFGEVWLGVHKETQDAFALKIMRKEQIIKDSLYDQVLREKAVLNTVKHPFCVGLKCAFQTDGKLV